MLLSWQYMFAVATPPVTTTTAFWKKSLKKTLDSEIHGFHFTTHQETPCCKIIRLWHTFKKVLPIGNFIRTRGLCIDFSFLLYIGSEHEDMQCYTEILASMS
jgi:hypothetical protein